MSRNMDIKPDLSAVLKPEHIEYWRNWLRTDCSYPKVKEYLAKTDAQRTS